MSGYFKFVGIILIIGAVGWGIYSIVEFVDALFAVIDSGSSEGWKLILLWLLSFIVSIIFAPALGLLFYSYGQHLECAPIHSAVRTTQPAQKVSGNNWETNPTAEKKKEPEIDESWQEAFEKRSIIAKNNYDKHLSEDEVERLMKLPLDEVKKKLGE